MINQTYLADQVNRIARAELGRKVKPKLPYTLTFPDGRVAVKHLSEYKARRWARVVKVERTVS